MRNPLTPYYLIDERRLLRNLKVVQRVREMADVRCVLALKCFATWAVFGLLRRYLDGTTSSGVYEARLGRAKFGKEVHAYSVAFSEPEIREVRRYADKVIFNSVSQLRAFADTVSGLSIGLRVNPGFSHSHYDLADPARRYSRLGVCDHAALRPILPRLNGIMFHFNCENDHFTTFARHLDQIAARYGDMLHHLEWVSLGGGLRFTSRGYPLEAFCAKLRAFAQTFGVQVYLEPGDAVVTGAGQLVTHVLDVVRNEMEIAIVDASLEAHLLDHLVYRTSPPVEFPPPGRVRVMIAGRSCLAGDVFGIYRLRRRLRPGAVVRFGDAAAYTVVKKNWFNGLPMPAIAVRRLNGKLEIVRRFAYKEYVASLA